MSTTRRHIVHDHSTIIANISETVRHRTIMKRLA